MPRRPRTAREPAPPEGVGQPAAERTSPLNGLDIRAWMRFTRSWFLCNPPPRRPGEKAHPAKFPEQMVQEFVRFFTAPGETVLDPFAGVGSTLAAAEVCGRRGVGIELSPVFRRLAAERPGGPVGLLLAGDARRAPLLLAEAGVERVDYVITSPPYWNMLRLSRGNARSVHRRREEEGLSLVYSDLPEDLGNLSDYDLFLSELTAVLAGLRPVLGRDRYLTVVTQNVRVPSGEVRPLAWDLAGRLSSYYTFKGERIWVQDNKRLGPWGWPREYVTNVHHHYCLTFKNDRA